MKNGINWKSASLITAMIMAITTANSQPDTVRITSLLKSGSDYILRPGSEKSDLDSALFLINQALALSRSIHSDKWTKESLEWKGDCYLEGDHLVPGEACFQEIIGYNHKKGDRRGEANTWSRLGECITNVNPGFSAEKAKCFEHARRVYHLAGDTLHELKAYKDEADAHLWTRNFDLAEKELLAVVEGFRAIHFHYLHYTYDLLRAVSILKGNLVNEVFYAMEMVRSLDSTDAKDDSTLFGGMYASAANTYARAGMWDRSLIYSRKGWMWAKTNPDSYMDYYRLVAWSLLRKDSAIAALDFLSAAIELRPPSNAYQRATVCVVKGNCYCALNDYGKAEKEYLKMIPFLDSNEAGPHDHTRTPLVLEMNLALGNFYLIIHRYDKAEA